jgi:all-trans-retinol 13,14-reductase
MLPSWFSAPPPPPPTPPPPFAWLFQASPPPPPAPQLLGLPIDLASGHAAIVIAIVVVLIVSFGAWLKRTARLNGCCKLADGANPAPLASIACLKEGFASRKVPEQVDVLVIGSGISGLLSAALLAKCGKRCVVVEQHDQAGGSTHTFEEKGFEFDTGLHYVGELLGVLLNSATTGTIQWAGTGIIVDEVIVHEERVAIRHPKARFLSDLHGRFPSQKRAIDAYARKLDTSRAALMARVVLRLLPRWLHSLLAPLIRALLPMRSTLSELCSLTGDQRLVSLLGYIWGTFGLPPSRSPFAMTAIIQTHYFGGAYYPVGGCSQLAARLVPTILAAGGKVFVRAPVSDLLFDSPGGACVGAVVKGHEVRAQLVVSGAGLLNTLKLCPKAERPRLRVPPKALRDGAPLRCDNRTTSGVDDDWPIEPSNAFAYLFIGLDAGGGEAPDCDTPDSDGSPLWAMLPKHNMWVLPSWDHEEDSALPRALESADDHPLLLFISSPSAKDPSWRSRYPGRATIVALAPTRYEYWSERGGERVHHRGPEYDKFKHRLQERMLEKVLELLPAIKGHISHVTLGTPLSNNFFLGTKWGEAYGLEHTAKRFDAPYLRPATQIPGLYLTGQDTMTDGVAGAAIAGLLTASAIDVRVPLRNLGIFATMAVTA